MTLVIRILQTGQHIKSANCLLQTALSSDIAPSARGAIAEAAAALASVRVMWNYNLLFAGARECRSVRKIGLTHATCQGTLSANHMRVLMLITERQQVGATSQNSLDSKLRLYHGLLIDAIQVVTNRRVDENITK